MIFKITTSKHTYCENDDAASMESLLRLGFTFVANGPRFNGEGFILKPDFIEKEISTLDELLALVHDLDEEIIVGKGTLRIFNWYES